MSSSWNTTGNDSMHQCGMQLSRSWRTCLTFPVGRIHRMLRKMIVRQAWVTDDDPVVTKTPAPVTATPAGGTQLQQRRSGGPDNGPGPSGGNVGGGANGGGGGGRRNNDTLPPFAPSPVVTGPPPEPPDSCSVEEYIEWTAAMMSNGKCLLSDKQIYTFIGKMGQVRDVKGQQGGAHLKVCLSGL
ncbi:hypothetical protein MRX96_029715 [Rhipicephalus microplus]